MVCARWKSEAESGLVPTGPPHLRTNPWELQTSYLLPSYLPLGMKLEVEKVKGEKSREHKSPSSKNSCGVPATGRCAWQHAGCYTWVLEYTSHNSPGTKYTVIPVLQTWKLRLREVKKLVQSHTAGI